MIRKSVFVLCLFCCSAAWATCPAGYTSAPGAASTDDCYMEIQPGYYWTGTAVELCPAEHACAGGNMPYSARGAAWGIIDCAYPRTLYTGRDNCGCPIDPLSGQKGTFNESHQTCYKTDIEPNIHIGVNGYTTGKANCYWNGEYYAAWGDFVAPPVGYDTYRITACAAGYWAPTTYEKYAIINCIPVGAGYIIHPKARQSVLRVPRG